MERAKRVIAIDGPAGSGKSTVARLVARELGFTYLDTGAIYRSLAWFARSRGVSWNDGEALASLCAEMRIVFEDRDGEVAVFVNGIEVTSEIRTEEMGRGASLVGAHPEVRRALVDLQRGFVERGGLVAEGRDMGTVIFPDATLKVFLVASAGERARRRWREMKERGVVPLPSLEEVERSIRERDLQDATRETAPLQKAEDAVELDTTGLTVEEVVGRVVELFGSRCR